MSMLSRLIGTLKSHEGDVATSSLEGKTILFYFSAHWCPPCRHFTPQLVAFYKKLATEKNFEVVFCTCDKSEEEFKEYFNEMPWLAIPYSESQVTARLSSEYAVFGIPALIVVGPDGAKITNCGRQMVTADPSGVEFPWPGSEEKVKSQQRKLILGCLLVVAVVIYLLFLR